MPTHHEKILHDADGKPHKYLVSLHPAEEGFDLLDDLLETLGGSVGQLSDASLLNLDTTAGAIGKMMAELAVRVRKKGGAELLKRVFAHTVRDKKKFSPERIATDENLWTINATFRGNYGEMMEAAAFVLEVNFRSFFDWFTTTIQERIQSVLPPESSDSDA
jgi:hypothetical protein